jgi:hypothetical protein
MKTFKVIGVLALVFLAGFAGGVVATRVMVRRMVAVAMAHPDKTREQIRVNYERNLEHKLHLDQQQRERVHDILKESREKFRNVREEFQPRLNAIATDTRTNIMTTLKPEQQDRFEQFLADNQQFLAVRDLSPPKKD